MKHYTSSEASVESQDAVTNVSFLLQELERTGHTLLFKEEALRAISAAQSELLSSFSKSALVNAEFREVAKEIESEAEWAEMIEQPSQAWNRLVHVEVLNASQQAKPVQIAEA